MEELHIYSTKFVSFHMASGGQRWHIVGCYLSPDNASTIEDVVEAIRQHPWGAVMLVDGNFNTDLAAPEGW